MKRFEIVHETEDETMAVTIIKAKSKKEARDIFKKLDKHVYNSKTLFFPDIENFNFNQVPNLKTIDVLDTSIETALNI